MDCKSLVGVPKELKWISVVVLSMVELRGNAWYIGQEVPDGVDLLESRPFGTPEEAHKLADRLNDEHKAPDELVGAKPPGQYRRWGVYGGRLTQHIESLPIQQPRPRAALLDVFPNPDDPQQ